MKKNAQPLYNLTPGKKSAIQISVFFLSFLLFFVIFSYAFRTFGVPVGWDTTESVSPKNFTIASYSTAQQGSLISVAAFSEENDKPGIYSIVSFNKGESFFPPRFIGAPASEEFSKTLKPQTAVSKSGKAAIIWQDFSEDDSSYRLYLSLSDNKGKSWKNTVKLNFGSEMEMLPVVSFDELERLHIIYHALAEDHIRIFHTMQKDEAFTQPVMISLEESKIRGAFFPAVVIEGNNMYVVWQGKENAETLHDDLYFTRSIDYGKSWTTPIRATLSEYDDNAPSLVAVGETLYLAYINNENANWELKFLRGLAYGEVWEEKPADVFQTNINCLSPHFIQEDRDNLRLFWYQSTGENESIMTARYNLIENNFSGPEQISDGERNSVHPSTIKTEKTVTILWLEQNSLVSKSTDTYVAPPSIESNTHPFGEWSQFASAELKWTPPADDSGIAGYATIVNREKYFDPTVQNIDSPNMQTRIPFLPDGVSYFHIRAIDRAGNYSRTIHFPLLVSSNPLSTPVVKSNTHEEGKSSEKRSVQFLWEQEGEERVKGYYYSFNSGSALVPDKFTEDKRLNFDSLKDGRYFLAVRAVDKTGNPGRIATFELLIGDVESIDAREYEKMAQNIEKEQDYSSGAVVYNEEVIIPDEEFTDEPAVELPQKEVVILFDDSAEKKPGVLKFTIQYRDNDTEGMVNNSFSYTLYKDGRFFSNGISETGEVIIQDAPDADYSVQAHGTFSYNIDGKLVSGLTETVSEQFKLTTSFDVPVDRFYNSLISTFVTDWRVNSLFILSLTFALAFSLGFFRIYYVTRVFFNRLVQRMLLIFH